MALSCIYKTSTGEVSDLYESLKKYYKEDFDNNKDPKIKNIGDKIENISEHWYHYVYSKEFKEWYGEGELNSQGEPVLNIYESGGITFAFFKNDKGDTDYISSAKFSGLDINVANEITDQLIYYIFDKFDAIDFESTTSIKRLNNVYRKTINGILEDKKDLYRRALTKAKTPEEKERINKIAKSNLNKIARILNKYENDFNKSIQARLKSFSIEYNTVELNSDEVSEYENFGDVVKKDKGKTNSKDSATSNIKMLLSFSVPEVVKTESGNKVATGVLLGLPKFKRFGSVWNTLEPALSNMPTLMEKGDFVDRKQQYLDKIDELSKTIPGLKILKSKLASLPDDSQVLMQFNKAFDKSKTTYNRAKFTTGNGGYTTQYITNDRDTPVDLVYAEWSNALADSEYVKDGVINITSWLSGFASVKDDVDKLSNHLSKIGINVGRNAFIGVNKDSLYGAIALINGKSIKSDQGRIINIYASINNKLKLFATNEAINRGIVGENTVLGPNGLYWAYSNRTFMDTVLDEIKQGDLSYIEKLRKNPYTQNSLLFGKDKSAAEIIDTFKNINIQQFLSLQVDFGDAGVDSKGINYYDELVTSINRTLQNVLLNGTSASNMLAAADKSSTFLLSGLPFKQTNGQLTNSGAVKMLRGYLIDEINTARQGSEDVLFKKGLLESQGIFLFNSLKTLENLKEDKELNWLVSNENGVLKTNFKDPKTFTKEDIEAIDEVIRKEINTSINKYIEVFKEATNDNVDSAFDQNIVKAYKEKHPDNYIKIMLADFFVNGMVANVEMTKLFTGYPGFYKSEVDFFKRVPATQTDGKYLYLTKGDPRYYKIAVVDEITTPSNVIAGYVRNTDGEIVEFEGKPVVTKYAQEIYELEKSLGRPTSLEQVADILDDYSDNNIGDAQAWITYDRAKFIAQRLGEWSKDMDKIDLKIQNDQPLTSDEIAKVGSMLQPQKGVHFENTENGPVYLKYSQAVLIPSLIKNTGLEEIYNAMKASGVDELITIDGVKVGPGRAGENGRLESIQEAVAKGKFTNTKLLENKFWKKQQELPSKKIKFGTLASQIQKNILSNILLDSTRKVYNFRGEDYSGYDIVTKIQDTTRAILNIQRQQLFDELGITADQDLSTIKNNPKLKQVIIDELSRNNPDNIIQAVEASDQFDLIPVARDKVQSVLTSYFKKRLNDIQMNVGSMIQISNYGTNKLSVEDKSGIKWLVDEQTLEGPVFENGRFKSGQVLMPSWLIAQHIPNWKDLSIEELNKRIDPKLFKVLGFRIPNQGMSSNDSLEVVGILPPEAGDSVMVYNGLTTKTGSDFDIDKMYMLFPNMVKQSESNFDDFNISYKEAKRILASENILVDIQNPKKELRELMIEYKERGLSFNNQKFNEKVFEKFEIKDPSKNKLTYTDKGIKGLQNELLELYLSILESPATYVDLVKSIDKDTSKLKNAIKENNPEVSNEFGTFDPIRQVSVKNGLLKGKGGVGVTANHLVNHAYTQLYGVKVSNDFETFDITGEYDFDQSTKITGIISAFLNAFVDIAKEPYVLNGNFVNYTMGPTFLLLRSGYNYKTVAKFMSLPVIKELVKSNEYNDSKLFVGPDYGYLDELASAASIEGVVAELNNDELDSFKNNIIPKRIKDEFPEVTLDLVKGAYINLFRSLKKDAQKLTEFQQATSYEVNGPGRTIARQIATLNRVYDVIQNRYLENVDNVFNSETILGHRLKQGVLDLLKLESNTFYEARIPDVINKISEVIIGDKAKSEQESDDLSKYMESVYTELYKRILNIQNPNSYFTQDWATKLTELKKKYPKNEFLKILNYEIHDDKVFYKINNTKNKDVNEMNAIVQGWRDLINGPESDFGNSLIYKSFLESGFTYNLHSYYNLIPYEFFIRKDIVKAYNRVIQDLENVKSVEKLTDNIVLNNPSLIRGKMNMLGGEELKLLRNRAKNIMKDKNLIVDMVSSKMYYRNKGVLYKQVGTFQLEDFSYSIYKKMPQPIYENQSGFKAFINQYEKTTFTKEDLNTIAKDGIVVTKSDFMTDFNIIEEMSDYLETGKPFPVSLSGNSKFSVPGVNFIINPGLRTKTGGKQLGSSNLEKNLIQINPVSSTEEFLAYFKGEVKSETSEQKMKVFEVLSEMGYDEAFFVKLLDNEIKANQLLVFHEKSHLDNKDELHYWDNGKDLLTPDKIKIEVRATVEAIKNLQNLYTEKAVQGNLFEQSDFRESVKRKMAESQKGSSAEKHLPKEFKKVDKATQFIGEGLGSTGKYAAAWGDRANTGNYSSSDVIMLAANGKRNGRFVPVKDGKLQGAYQNIDKAIEAGASFVADTEQHLKGGYNVGEIEIADYLSSKGYTRTTVDGVGYWQKSSTSNEPLNVDTLLTNGLVSTEGLTKLDVEDAEVFTKQVYTKEESQKIFDYIEQLYNEEYNSKHQPSDKFGKGRRSMYFSDTPYTYSGTTRPANLGPMKFQKFIQRLVEKIGFQEGYFDMILINEYQDGNQKIGFHTDNEPILNNKGKLNPSVVTISFGEERTMILQGNETYDIPMKPGMALIMGKNGQTNYKHGIAPEQGKGKRFSITLRHNAEKSNMIDKVLDSSLEKDVNVKEALSKIENFYNSLTAEQRQKVGSLREMKDVFIQSPFSEYTADDHIQYYKNCKL